jgi:NAD(P)-dependent dehydrogenase (short-subunit alcohol dehydrogenase family)
MSRLNGKVVLVSGGARGIGAATARTMVAEGAKVVIGDLLDAEGQALAKEIGPSATYVHLDVTKANDWQTAVENTVATYGKLNVLMNNAGLGDRGPMPESNPETTDEAEWDRVIDVNLKGTFLGTKYALPAMKKAGGGSIINLSSMAAMVASGGPLAYTAAKGGVRSMSKHIAFHYGAFNIRVNSIYPGSVNTAMIEEPLKNEDVVNWLTGRIPLGRIGEPTEIANLALFLASDESSYLTGAELVVDGGYTIA